MVVVGLATTVKCKCTNPLNVQWLLLYWDIGTRDFSISGAQFFSFLKLFTSIEDNIVYKIFIRCYKPIVDSSRQKKELSNDVFIVSKLDFLVQIKQKS